MDNELINDEVISTDSTWSSSKINTELSAIKQELDEFIAGIITNEEILNLFN